MQDHGATKRVRDSLLQYAGADSRFRGNLNDDVTDIACLIVKGIDTCSSAFGSVSRLRARAKISQYVTMLHEAGYR